jgi:hypothetical protein
MNFDKKYLVNDVLKVNFAELAEGGEGMRCSAQRNLSSFGMAQPDGQGRRVTSIPRDPLSSRCLHTSGAGACQ